MKLTSEKESELIISCPVKTSFTIIDNTKTKELENGCAMTEWKGLKHCYKTVTHAEKCQLQQEFQNMKLKSRQDPDHYITKLEKIKYHLFNTHKAPSDKE